MNKQQFLTNSIIGLALYLISTGLSFGAFTFIGKVPSGSNPGKIVSPVYNAGVQSTIDPSIPRTEACPLNGLMYTKQERDVWEKRRPLAVMIEDHVDARPQSGLSSADIVYETVAEGGINRFMAVFYCGAASASVTLAPVRSARTYFLPWVLEYDALYNHVGGAGLCNDPTVDTRAKALCQIGQYRIKDLDQFGISFPTCYRNYDRLDHTVATEHTMVCDSDKLYALASQRGWTNVDTKGVSWDAKFQSWKFKDDAVLADRVASFSANFVLWKGYEKEYGVRWDYDRTTNSYKRVHGGVTHTDLENKKQLTASNIVIIFAKETGPVDEHAHLLYNNIGSGTGLMFQDGKAIKITWRKPDKSSRTLLFDTNSKEVLFNRGQTWIEMLGIGTPVNY